MPGPAPNKKRHRWGMVPRATYEIDEQRAEVMIQVAHKYTKMFQRQDCVNNKRALMIQKWMFGVLGVDSA